MSQSNDIRFHNVLPTQSMIDQATRTSGTESPQVKMAQAVLDFVATEDGREQFGDAESGSTLEQIWRLRLSSSGVRLVCLVASGRDGLTTSAIPNAVPQDPKQLVETMAQLLSKHPNTSLHPFVYDGQRGYPLTLLGYDPASTSFTVTEPNAAASKIGTIKSSDGSWTLSAQRMTDAVCALFLPPQIWADLNGVNHAINYESVQQTEFWKFFALTESKRQPIANNEQIVFLTPGGFKKENKLQLRLNEANHVRGAVLLQARPWMMTDSVINPFALDLAKSFVQELTPEPDDTSDLVAGIWALRSMEELNKLNIAPESEVGLFLQAYMGARPEGWVLKDFVRIHARTIQHEGIKFMQLQMDHW